MKNFSDYISDLKTQKVTGEYHLKEITHTQYLDAHNVVFENCELYNLDMISADFCNCTFKNCKIIQSSLDWVVFHNCKIISLEFHYCELSISYMNCEVQEIHQFA